MGYLISERRRLGRTNLMVSPIGLGGAWLGKSSAESETDCEVAIVCVMKVLDSGINLIDTSTCYGSEESIGMALEEWYKRGGKREDIVLTTKTGTRVFPPVFTYDETMACVEQSLKLLKTDYLDVVFIHDPIDIEPALAEGAALDVLKDLKKQGVIKGIGLGVRKHEFHKICIQTGDFDVCLTYRDYNLIDQSITDEILPLAGEYDVGIFNGTPIIKGLLGGRDPLEIAKVEPPVYHPLADNPYILTKEEVDLARKLWEFANKHEVGLLALNLQYCLREKRIVSTLLGSSNINSITRDIDALSVDIKDEVWQELYEQFGI